MYSIIFGGGLACCAVLDELGPAGRGGISEEVVGDTEWRPRWCKVIGYRRRDEVEGDISEEGVSTGVLPSDEASSSFGEEASSPCPIVPCDRKPRRRPGPVPL